MLTDSTPNEYIGIDSLPKEFNFAMALTFDRLHHGYRPFTGTSFAGSVMPLFTAFSVKRNWLACYYHYCCKSILRIYKLDTRRLSAECLVDPIFNTDCAAPPLYSSEDGTRLVIVSAGKRHIFDTTTGQWSQENHAVPTKDPIADKIRDSYYSAIKKWLPRETRKYKKSPLIKRIVKAVLLLVVLPISGKIVNTGYPSGKERIENIPVKRIGDYYLTVDTDRNIVCVFNEDGELLCADQFNFSISSADRADDTLYVLPENIGDLVSEKFTKSIPE
jgi:hypothetical protein